MTFSEYTEKALATAKYTDEKKQFECAILGLVGESGELADKFKKIKRLKEGFDEYWNLKYEIKQNNLRAFQIPFTSWLDKKAEESSLSCSPKDFAKELGDILWYINSCAYILGYTLEEIAEMNIKKLEDRNNRGVIQSEGDSR